MTREIVVYSKLIHLTKGKFAKVGYWWYEWLNQWKWCLGSSKRHNILYAERGVWTRQHKVMTVTMHKAVMGLPPNGFVIDHVNGNGLDETPGNLRFATHQENMRNRVPKGKYKGIYTKTRHNKNGTHVTYYASDIRINKILKHLGVFPYTEEGKILAAKAYDEAAKKYFGEFAALNFPDNCNKNELHSLNQ